MTKQQQKQNHENNDIGLVKIVIWLAWLIGPTLMMAYKLTGGHALDGFAAANIKDYPWQTLLATIAFWSSVVGTIVAITVSVMARLTKRWKYVILSVVLPIPLSIIFYFAVPNIMHTNYSCDQWKREGVDVIYCNDKSMYNL